MEGFLHNFTVFLIALLVSYLISKKANLPVIPLYIIAGILVSVTLHIHEVKIFETLGVILLLFYIGLEFSLAELEKNIKAILSVGVVDLLINIAPVFLLSKVLGFDNFTSFVLAVILYPSSSAIISKLLIDYKKLANPEVDPVLAILVFEDIAAAIFLALISKLSKNPLSPVETTGVIFKVFLFVIVAFAVIKYTKRLVDVAFQKVGTSTEFLVLFSSAVIFSIVEATLGFGLSESIGAFIAGTLFAESSFKEQVESVIIPYRELFGSLFFLTFGLSIDVNSLSLEILPILMVLLLFSFFLKLITGIIAVRFYKLSLKRGVSAGIMLLPRGEFSILLSAYVPKLVPLTAAYVLGSSILGSLALKDSEKLLSKLFKKKRKKKSKLTRSQLLEE